LAGSRQCDRAARSARNRQDVVGSDVALVAVRSSDRASRDC
jgi:hypothetical protein